MTVHVGHGHRKVTHGVWLEEQTNEAMLSEPNVPPEQNLFVLCSAMVQTDKVSFPNNVPFFTLSFSFVVRVFPFIAIPKKRFLRVRGESFCVVQTCWAFDLTSRICLQGSQNKRKGQK